MCSQHATRSNSGWVFWLGICRCRIGVPECELYPAVRFMQINDLYLD